MRTKGRRMKRRTVKRKRISRLRKTNTIMKGGTGIPEFIATIKQCQDPNSKYVKKIIDAIDSKYLNENNITISLSQRDAEIHDRVCKTINWANGHIRALGGKNIYQSANHAYPYKDTNTDCSELKKTSNINYEPMYALSEGLNRNQFISEDTMQREKQSGVDATMSPFHYNSNNT